MNVYRITRLIALSALLSLGLSGCDDKSKNHSGNNPPPPPPPPPPVKALPTAPTIKKPVTGDTIIGDTIDDNKVFLYWEWSAENGVPGTKWYVIDNGVNGQEISEFNNNSANNQDGVVSSPYTEGSHTLSVNLCNDNGCTPSTNSVTITLHLPEPAPSAPRIVLPENKLRVETNASVNIIWTAETPAAIKNGYWDLYVDNIKKTSYLLLLDENKDGSQSGKTSWTFSKEGTHLIKVMLCNDKNQCSPSNDVSIMVNNPTPPAKKVVAAYYGSWGVYGRLKHGGGTTIDPNDTNKQVPVPYQISGSYYQSGPSGTDLSQTTNQDFNAAVKNLDIMYYAFAEIYPDQDTGAYYPLEDQSLYGTVTLSDPYADLNRGTDINAPTGICTQEKVLKSSQEYSPTIDLLCFAAYRNSPSNFFKSDYSDANHDTVIQNNWIWWYQKGTLSAFANLKNTNPNLKRIISVGGWAHEKGFEDGAFVNPQQFADTVLALIQHYDLDGVDLDYEPPTGYTGDNADKLVNLSQVIRATFDAKSPNKKLYITAAVFADPAKIKAFDNGKSNWKTLSESLDYINVMGYDFHGMFDGDGANSDFHSNLFLDPENPNQNNFSVDLAIAGPDGFLAYNVPKEKLILGIPSYARAVRVSKSENNNLYQPIVTSNPFVADMDDASNPSAASGSESYYSTILGSLTGDAALDFRTYEKKTLSNDYGQYANWAFKDDIFASYDSAETVKTKAKYVNDQGLGGMMMWEMIADVPPNLDASNSLVCSMVKGLNNADCDTSTN